MTEPARFSVNKIDHIPVVAVEGEVDISNVVELKAFLENAADEGPGVVVDLTRASYFDSRTIATIADFSTRMNTSRQRVALIAPANGFAGKILRIAGLSPVVPTFESLDDAILAVKLPR